MAKRWKWLAATLIFGIAMSGTLFTIEQVLADNIPASQDKVTIMSEMQGETIALLGGEVGEFAINYTKGSAINYLPTDGIAADRYLPKPATISWENSRDDALYYTLRVGLERDLSDADNYIVSQTTADIDYLFAAKHYYYQVYAHYENDEVVKSRVFDFYTADLPRTVYIDGVTNTRDIGGRYVLGGQYQVKQGMVYRGAEVDRSLGAITEEGRRVMLYDLGIKTDLDLRGGDVQNSTGTSPIDESLNYIHVEAPWYTHIYNAQYKEAFATEFRTFANPDNYPIYLHCSLGRDRAGTLSALLAALVGVEEIDLFRDYEMSFFSKVGLTDATQSAGLHAELLGYFRTALNYIKNTYPAATLMDSVERYVIEYLGLTKAEVDSIRTTLLEEVEDQATESVAECAVLTDDYGITATKGLTLNVIEEDVSAPVIALDLTQVKAKVGAKPMLAVGAMDNNGSISLTKTWSDGALDNRGRLTVGEHIWTLTASDVFGDAATKTVKFIVTADEPTYSVVTDESELFGDCTVTFDGENSISVPYGFKVPKPATVPTKETTAEASYTFIGWYLGDKAWNFDNDVVTGDLDLQSKWKTTKCTYTVSFDGRVVGEKCEYGSVIPTDMIPKAPTKPATYTKEFTFSGWYFGDKRWDFETDVVKGDTALVARFEERARTYTVTFDGENEQKCAYGTKVTKPSIPEKAPTATHRYEFIGWFNGNTQWDFENDVVKWNMQLQSKWREIPLEAGGTSPDFPTQDTADNNGSQPSGGCSGFVGGISGSIAALGVALITLFKKKESK